MKKRFFTSVMLAAAVFSLCAINVAPANATCPAKKDCVKEMPQPVEPQERGFKPMSPEEHAKMMEAKKAEFEARLKLTPEQKAQIEKIKADEKKALKSCRANIKKTQEKLDKLIAKEMEVRAENVKQFQALLTEDQKEELKKIHEEMKAERDKFVPCSCDCGCPVCDKHHDLKKEKDCGLKGPGFGPGPKGPEFGPRGPHHPHGPAMMPPKDGAEVVPVKPADAPEPPSENSVKESPAAI